MERSVLREAEALEAVAGPDALERFSSLASEAFLAVDLRDTATVDVEAWCAARTARAELPCPTFALCAGPREPTEAFDVCVPDEAPLAPLCAAATRAPLAALALVQLLRQGEARSLHEALAPHRLDPGHAARACRSDQTRRRP